MSSPRKSESSIPTAFDLGAGFPPPPPPLDLLCTCMKRALSSMYSAPSRFLMVTTMPDSSIKLPAGELFKSILELSVAPDSEVVSGFFGCSIDHAVAVDRHVDAGAFLSGLGVFADSASDVGFVDELAIEGVVHRPKVQDSGVFVLNQEFPCD